MVLWLRDLRPGAGWGLLDHAGRPKAAWHHLRRALAPVAVWTTDEGLGGVAVHVANDRPEPLDATLRVALYRDGEVRVEEAAAELRLAPRSAETHDLEGLLGRFVDAAWSYRFGPPGHDAIVVSLERGGEPLSQAVRFPAGRPLAVQPAAALGLEAHVADGGDGGMALHLSARRLVWGVRVAAPGFAAADDAFCLEPGVPRTVSLSPERPTTEWSGGALRALNLAGGIMLRPLS